MNLFFLLSLFEPDGPISGAGPMSQVMKERLIILGAVLLVSLALLGWAWISRKKRRRSARREERHRRRSMFQNARKGVSEIKEMVQDRKRRRRREHRPRNPTLAETGGLPPPRRDEPPAPPPPQPH